MDSLENVFLFLDYLTDTQRKVMQGRIRRFC